MALSPSRARTPRLSEDEQRTAIAAFHRARGHSQGLSYARFRGTAVQEAFATMPDLVAQRLFREWDSDRSGEISVTEFLVGITNAAKGSRNDHLALAFRLMMTSGQGNTVSKAEAAQFLACIATSSGCVAIQQSTTMTMTQTWSIERLQYALFASSQTETVTLAKFQAVLGGSKAFSALYIIDWIPALARKLLSPLHENPRAETTAIGYSTRIPTLFTTRSSLSSNQREAVRCELESVLLDWESKASLEYFTERLQEVLDDNDLLDAVRFGWSSEPAAKVLADSNSLLPYPSSNPVGAPPIHACQELQLFVLALCCSSASSATQVYRALFELFDEDNCGKINTTQLGYFLQLTGRLSPEACAREANIVIRRCGSPSLLPSPPVSPVASSVVHGTQMSGLTLAQFTEVAQRQCGFSSAEVETALLLFHMRRLELDIAASENGRKYDTMSLLRLLDSYKPKHRASSEAFCLLDNVEWRQILEAIEISERSADISNNSVTAIARSGSQTLSEEVTDLPSGHVMVPLSIWLIIAFWFRIEERLSTPSTRKLSVDLANWTSNVQIHQEGPPLVGRWIRVSMKLTGDDGLERNAIFPQVLVFECSAKNVVDAVLFRKGWGGEDNEHEERDSSTTAFCECHVVGARRNAAGQITTLVPGSKSADIPHGLLPVSLNCVLPTVCSSWGSTDDGSPDQEALELQITMVELRESGKRQVPASNADSIAILGDTIQHKQPSGPLASFNIVEQLTEHPEHLQSGDVDASLVTEELPRGLINLGNTCFMNSALQCLAATPLLSKYFIEAEHRSELTSLPSASSSQSPPAAAVAAAKAVPPPNDSLPLVFGQLLAEVNGKSTEGSLQSAAISPKRLLKILHALFPHLCDGNQQDAQEFLVCLLGRLGDELKRHPIPKACGEPSILSPRSRDLLSRLSLFSRSKHGQTHKNRGDNAIPNGAECEPVHVPIQDSNGRHDRLVATEWWVSHLVNEPSVITALFSGQFKSVLACDHCAFQSARFEPFSSLQLPLASNSDAHTSRARVEDLQVHVVVIVHFSPTSESHGSSHPDLRGPVRVAIPLHKDATLGDLLSRLPRPRLSSGLSPRRRYVVGKLHGFTIQDLLSPQSADDDLETTTPTETLPSPLHVFELTNVSGSGDSTARSSPRSTRALLRFVHRRPILVPFYCSTPTRQSLCGQPFVYSTSLGGLTGRALYRMVHQRFHSVGGSTSTTRSGGSQLTEDKHDSMEFVLRRVREDGVACSRCHWTSGCSGCLILPTTTAAELLDLGEHEIVAVDWDARERQQRWWLHSLATRDDESYTIYRRTKTHSLMDSLRSLCNTECLEAVCSRCSQDGTPKLTPHTKQLALWSLPPLLVLQLKRFELAVGERGYRWEKLTHSVDFPVQGLDLSELLAPVAGAHVESETCDARCTVGDADERVRRGVAFLQQELGVSLASATRMCTEYDLYAIVNHSGGGLGSGHYTAQVRRRNAGGGRWWLADDASVSPISADALSPSAAAYLLFYVRRDVADGARDLSDLFPCRAADTAVAAASKASPEPPCAHRSTGSARHNACSCGLQ